MDDTSPADHASRPMIPLPFATPGHLYLLVAGILLGVVLGPAVLGRWAPQTYDAWFVGGGENAPRLAREEAALAEHLKLLDGMGVTDVAADELLLRETQRLAPLKLEVQTAQAERTRAVRGWLGAIVAALVLLSIAEPLLTPDLREASGPTTLPRALAGLVTARYALLVVWLTIAVAKPDILADLPWALIAGLVVVAAAAAFAPLGRRR